MLAAFSERQCLTPSHLSVSSSRSSNRACRFPALGLQTRSCIHPRKARPRLHKANQTVGVIQILIREIYRFPALRLVFPLLTPIPLIVGEKALRKRGDLAGRGDYRRTRSDRRHKKMSVSAITSPRNQIKPARSKT